VVTLGHEPAGAEVVCRTHTHLVVRDAAPASARPEPAGAAARPSRRKRVRRRAVKRVRDLTARTRGSATATWRLAASAERYRVPRRGAARLEGSPRRAPSGARNVPWHAIAEDGVPRF
jgi:hypothetical protein